VYAAVELSRGEPHVPRLGYDRRPVGRFRRKRPQARQRVEARLQHCHQPPRAVRGVADEADTAEDAREAAQAREAALAQGVCGGRAAQCGEVHWFRRGRVVRVEVEDWGALDRNLGDPRRRDDVRQTHDHRGIHDSVDDAPAPHVVRERAQRDDG